MPKNIFQDMVKINQTRRPAPEVKSETKVEPKVQARNELRRSFGLERSEERMMEDVEETMGSSVPRRRNTLWLVAIIAVVFFLFALSYLFSRAEVVIDPKTQNVNLNQNFSANLNGGSEDSLSFDMVTISGEESKTVVATEEKEVLESARGTVVIYNKFSSVPQRLDIDTRLEGSNGKIYKTEKALVVPGMKGSTPGSVEVTVYGAEKGEAYNSGPLDFKILGFKGGPKYEKFYGRSKGDLKGGFKGSSHVVSVADKAKALEELKVTLSAKLFQKATDQIPAGFILFKDAVALELEDTGSGSLLATGPTAQLTQKGTLSGIIFKEAPLYKKIMQNIDNKYDGSEVYIANLKNLSFTLNTKGVEFKDLKEIDFKLEGKAKIVWKIDVEKLKADLVGKSKKDFKKVLLEYPSINSANLSISPVWNRSIPEKSEDVKIIVNPVDAS